MVSEMKGVSRKIRHLRHFHKRPGGGWRRHLLRLAEMLTVHQQGIGCCVAGVIGRGHLIYNSSTASSASARPEVVG